jgi:type II secretory pathway component PulL
MAVNSRVIIVLGLVWLGLAWLAPGTARADEQEDQNACMADAQTYCGQFIPDRERVAHCLMANRQRISAACRVALKKFK